MKNKLKNILLSLAIVSLISVPILKDQTIKETKATSSINLNDYDTFDSTFNNYNYFECANVYTRSRLRVELNYSINESLYISKDEQISTFYVKYNTLSLSIKCMEYYNANVDIDTYNFPIKSFSPYYYNYDVNSVTLNSVFEEVQIDDTLLSFSFVFKEGLPLETLYLSYDYVSPYMFTYDGSYTYDLGSAINSYNLGLLYDFRDLNVQLGDAYNNGYQNGYTNGQSHGYGQGYTQGILDEQNNSRAINNFFDVIGNAFTSLGGFLSIEILPYISIGLLCSIPLAVGIILFVIKLISG